MCIRDRVDLHGIGTLLHIGHRVGKDVLLGVARESVDHGEIPLADSAGRDLEVAAGTVGHVVGRVGGRAFFPVGIDAEYGEVARVAGPYPFVGVAPELADRRGRGADQPHVVELLVNEQELLVAVIHLFD